MELFAFAMIPMLFLMLGVVFLVLSQLTGFFQFQQYYQRNRLSRRIMEDFVGQIGQADALLYSRAKELERLSRQLSLSNEELNRLNSLKSKFLSMAVHDMRNPLAVIDGFSAIVSAQVGDPKLKEYASHINTSAKQMNSLMADLTDLAVIEAGKLRIEPEEIDLRDSLRELGPGHQLLAAQRGLELTWSVPDRTVRAKADKGRLNRVFGNLLGNALKFTPKGGRIELALVEDVRWATVRVKDSGAGIHPTERAKIFEKFYQSKYQTTAAKKQGWGLGLSIAMEIVRLHGGRIGVDSPGLGKGSTFWVRVPILRRTS